MTKRDEMLEEACDRLDTITIQLGVIIGILLIGGFFALLGIV